jgi:osmotically-inducible protein OsmY
MTSRFLVITVAVASITCAPDVKEPPRESRSRAQAAAPADPDAIVPQSPEDRSIRRELSLAIERDATLKDRGISFIVSHGDVSLSGIVRSEAERQRINSLALGIPGVKSVANSLRVSE